MSFSGSSGFHANSKKSLVFLLKFLSDLVPYEPPPYLKVRIGIKIFLTSNETSSNQTRNIEQRAQLNSFECIILERIKNYCQIQHKYNKDDIF